MGLLAAFAGFAGSFAVVLQGLTSVGASPEQAASGLAVLSIAMGLGGILLSIATRMPVSIAWSTPGAALLVATGVIEGGFAAAVAGFLICGVLITITGLLRPFGRLIAMIPAPLANAMLAGILLELCLAPAKAVAIEPVYGLAILLAWVGVGFFNRILAVPAALAVFVLIVLFAEPSGGPAAGSVSYWPTLPLVPVMPELNLAAVTNIALPLFIVTMASQNIPGIAVLKSNDYELDPGPGFTLTGLFSVLSAPFGGHAVNLAAITAAMCAGEEAHPDRERRYWAAVISGVAYICFGLMAGAVTAFVALAPAILIQAVAGLALIGAFVKATVDAFEEVPAREAAAVTFLFSAAGISVAGISGAFWGLLAGGLVLLGKYLLERGEK